MSTNKSEDDIRVLSPAELLVWAEGKTQVMRLRTFRDVVPGGGYMAAMAPLPVDWRSIGTDSAEHDLVLRNVNYGSNPLERITVLHSLQFNTNAIYFQGLILVPPPSETGGRLTPWYHVQLRLGFEAGREAQLLNLAAADGAWCRFPFHLPLPGNLSTYRSGSRARAAGPARCTQVSRWPLPCVSSTRRLCGTAIARRLGSKMIRSVNQLRKVWFMFLESPIGDP